MQNSNNFTNFLSSVTKEDEGASIKCVFVPVYGDPIEVQKPINPGCECRLLKQYFLKHVFAGSLETAYSLS